MMYCYNVIFSVRKGLGPEWVEKTVVIAIDDIEKGTPEYEIKEMAKMEAKAELERRGLKPFIFQDIIAA